MKAAADSGTGVAQPPARQTLSGTAGAVAALAVACAAVELLAGPGYRLGWLGLGAALQTMRWAATAAGVVAVLALVVLVVAHRRHARTARGLSLAALVIGLAAFTPPAMLAYRVQQLPRIHDISTDTANPPRFVALLAQRQGARNPADYDPAVAPQQRRGYPDIAPVQLDMPPAKAFERAERAARSMGWEIAAVEPEAGRIEATATTLLFGFKDDVVIRVVPDGAGSRVDVRSLSRVGGSDFGTNAKRVRAFVKRLARAEE